MDTNPATEVSPEAQLEAAFQRQEDARNAPKEEAPEPDETDDEPAEDVEAKEKPEKEEAEETEEEGEEIEIDGEKFIVPKKIKDSLLKSKDYTQKTQAVAEQRKALDEREKAFQQAAQLHSAEIEKRVEVRAIETQLAAYEQIDWAALAESDPGHAMKLSFARDALLRKQAKASGELHEVQTYAKKLSAERRQQSIAQDAEVLARDIKGWGPELQAKIAQTGAGHGYTEAELEQVTARDIKVLHKAHLWDQLQASKALTTKKVSDVKPVTVKTARTTTQTQGQTQTDDAKARLKRTGKSEDAEAYFERLFSKPKR